MAQSKITLKNTPSHSDSSEDILGLESNFLLASLCLLFCSKYRGLHRPLGKTNKQKNSKNFFLYFEMCKIIFDGYYVAD